MKDEDKTNEPNLEGVLKTDAIPDSPSALPSEVAALRLIDRIKEKIGDVVADRIKENVKPARSGLPPWSQQLASIAIAALLAFLAAKYGIVVPVQAVPQHQPTVVVLTLPAGAVATAVPATPAGK